jgi:tRNA-specific 2-thiouridylase
MDKEKQCQGFHSPRTSLPAKQTMKAKPTKIIAAMSGGVDSAVAAALLAREHENVIGVMLKLWSDPSTENLCCTLDSKIMAESVAFQLGIPFHTLDAQATFREKVVEHFINAYREGDTPNPCIVCNQQVRWDILQSYADEIGASHVATGHYARLREDSSGRMQLLRGVDSSKDQSYVLYGLSQEHLSRTLFPLGEYHKSEIREVARTLSLPVSEKPDSQDLCFVGEEGYRDFLIRHTPEVVKPGSILSADGKVLGEHQGLAFYTIGQRKGLGIAAPQPYYVMAKEVRSNRLIVGTAADLGRDEAAVENVNWISGQPAQKPFHATIKIRYKAQEARGLVRPLNKARVHIRFDHPLRDITPGQSAVFYEGEVCLGGGIIVYAGGTDGR